MVLFARCTQVCTVAALTMMFSVGAFAAVAADEVTPAEAQAALQSADWETAISGFRALVKKDEKDYDSWFYLGYSLHASGDLEQAIEAHQKAAKSRRFGPIAIYNHACALALQGKKDSALDKLQQAVDAGFNSASQMQSDPDLDSLHETTEYREILASISTEPPPPSAPPKRTASTEFNFWVGEWKVVGKNGKTLGTNKVTAGQNGYLLTEQWTSANGGTGMSINFFDAAAKKWKQTWVDASGGVTYYEGQFADGKMQFEGPAVQPDGSTLRSKMEFTPNSDGSVRQFIEQSKDDGKTWTVYFDGTYVPAATKDQKSKD